MFFVNLAGDVLRNYGRGVNRIKQLQTLLHLKNLSTYEFFACLCLSDKLSKYPRDSLTGLITSPLLLILRSNMNTLLVTEIGRIHTALTWLQLEGNIGAPRKGCCYKDITKSKRKWNCCHVSALLYSACFWCGGWVALK